MESSLFERLMRFDDERPGLPGEHWLALGAGLWLLTRPGESTLGRLASLAAGAALVYRAASGRDGLARLLLRTNPMRRWLDRPGTRRLHQRHIDLAAPWPAARRVRVPAISQPIGGNTMWTP